MQMEDGNRLAENQWYVLLFPGWGGMYRSTFSSLAVKRIMPMRMERW